MRDDYSMDSTSLKQRFSAWSDTHMGLSSTGVDDVEPYSAAPAPARFPSPHIMSHFGPDPLLTVTPEKSLGFSTRSGLHTQNRTTRPGSPKSRQRVRFAPDTLTSPSEKQASSERLEGELDLLSRKDILDTGREEDEDDSQPRSFSFVSQKLYEPGRYSDGDSKSSVDDSLGASAPLSSTSALKSTKDSGQSSAYSCVPLYQASEGLSDSSKRNVKAKVIRHTAPFSLNDDITSMSSLEETQNPTHTSITSEHSSPARSPCRSSSRSPSRSSHPVSPGMSSRSPSRSPCQNTPTEPTDYSTLIEEDDDTTPAVMVIREAPRQPELEGYVFPFTEKEYDSSENPLARPEFNSALKIGEELKSVKAKRPDTWQAVNQHLNTRSEKRTQIQEKASSKVNVQRQSGMYADLVDINTPLDDFCQDVERGITLKAPSSKPVPSRVPLGKEPDLMEFFSPDLQPELPDLTLTGMALVSDGLTTADPVLALDLYRHNRAWNGMIDS